MSADEFQNEFFKSLDAVLESGDFAEARTREQPKACAIGGSCYSMSEVIDNGTAFYAHAESLFANKAKAKAPSVQHTQASVEKRITVPDGYSEARAWEYIKAEMEK